MIVFEDVVSRLSSFNIIMRCSPRARHQCLGVTRILPWHPGPAWRVWPHLVSGQYQPHPMPDVSRPRGGGIIRVSSDNRSDDCWVAPARVTITCLSHSLYVTNGDCLNVISAHCPHLMSPLGVNAGVQSVKHPCCLCAKDKKDHNSDLHISRGFRAFRISSLNLML